MNGRLEAGYSAGVITTLICCMTRIYPTSIQMVAWRHLIHSLLLRMLFDSFISSVAFLPPELIKNPPSRRSLLTRRPVDETLIPSTLLVRPKSNHMRLLSERHLLWSARSIMVVARVPHELITAGDPHSSKKNEKGSEATLFQRKLY